MSHDFKFKYDQLRENDPGKAEHASQTIIVPYGEAYNHPGSVRNICFVFKTGRKLILNYSYLIAVDYEPSEANVTFTFSTHKLILKGFKLDELVASSMFHIPMKIICVDERYYPVGKDETCVYEMNVIIEK